DPELREDQERDVAKPHPRRGDLGGRNRKHSLANMIHKRPGVNRGAKISGPFLARSPGPRSARLRRGAPARDGSRGSAVEEDGAEHPHVHVETMVLPIDGMQISGSVGVTDATFDDFPDAISD